jgi:hypothetical protein
MARHAVCIQALMADRAQAPAHERTGGQPELTDLEHAAAGIVPGIASV